MHTNYSIKIYKRPISSIRTEIVLIAKSLTYKWFTPNVPKDTYRDLEFQDVIILKQFNKIISFIMFTCLDGSIHISLMGTRPKYIGKGYGSILINEFFKYIKTIKHKRIIVYTVPPDKKQPYTITLAFYLKHGFKITKEYKELWESGAIQLIKEL